MKKLLLIALAAALLLVGCGGTAVNLDVNAVYAQLEQAAQIPEMTELKGDMLLNLYGIRQEDVKQCLVKVSSDGLLADEIWLIEAVSADAAKNITQLANNRLARKAAESVTYSPEQHAIVKKAVLINQGNYVILLVSPQVEAMNRVVNTALGK